MTVRYEVRGTDAKLHRSVPNFLTFPRDYAALDFAGRAWAGGCGRGGCGRPGGPQRRTAWPRFRPADWPPPVAPRARSPGPALFRDNGPTRRPRRNVPAPTGRSDVRRPGRSAPPAQTSSNGENSRQRSSPHRMLRAISCPAIAVVFSPWRPKPLATHNPGPQLADLRHAVHGLPDRAAPGFGYLDLAELGERSCESGVQWRAQSAAAAPPRWFPDWPTSAGRHRRSGNDRCRRCR